MAEQDQAGSGKAAALDARQPPIQLSSLSRSNSLDEEDIDKAIDELERGSSSDSLDGGDRRPS